MRFAKLFRRLRRSETGAAAIEFGLLGGFMITLLLGVLQVGIAMQSYNALRSISADISRHAVVQYQTGNEMTTSQLANFGRNLATGSPYNLPANGLTNVTVATAGTQRVTGATEMTLTVSSQVSSILGMVGLHGFTISHARPIFVIDE